MSPTPFTPAEHLLKALDLTVRRLTRVRAQLSNLKAAEAELLHVATELADQISQAERQSDRGMAHRMIASEIGTALHESDRTIAARMGQATTLVTTYPAVLNSLREGRITERHASTICDAGHIVGTIDARAEYEREALAYAEAETAGRLRPVARELAERYSNRDLDVRHAEARAGRMVRVVEGDDGMADLIATLPAVLAYGIKDRLDQAAHQLKSRGTSPQNTVQQMVHTRAEHTVRQTVQQGAQHRAQQSAQQSAQQTMPPTLDGAACDTRRLDEIRADLFTDLLLASDLSAVARLGTTGIAGLRARVQVVVPQHQLTDHAALPPPPSRVTARGSAQRPEATLDQSAATQTATRRPMVASLAGYGPIDSDTARAIAAHTPSWHQVNVTAETGHVLSVDTYRPNAQLKRFLGARDLHCRFPGCRTPLRRCDIDHTIDAALGGSTSSSNLSHLCRRHHTMKHATPWQVSQDSAGVLTWKSPTGRTHHDRPPSTVRFRTIPAPAPPAEQKAKPPF